MHSVRVDAHIGFRSFADCTTALQVYGGPGSRTTVDRITQTFDHFLQLHADEPHRWIQLECSATPSELRSSIQTDPHSPFDTVRLTIRRTRHSEFPFQFFAYAYDDPRNAQIEDAIFRAAPAGNIRGLACARIAMPMDCTAEEFSVDCTFLGKQIGRALGIPCTGATIAADIATACALFIAPEGNYFERVYRWHQPIGGGLMVYCYLDPALTQVGNPQSPQWHENGELRAWGIPPLWRRRQSAIRGPMRNPDPDHMAHVLKKYGAPQAIINIDIGMATSGREVLFVEHHPIIDRVKQLQAMAIAERIAQRLG